MSPLPPQITLIHRAHVGSTMDVLDELIADGAREWTVVLADEQTKGRGRAGRRWEAEPGSALLCSILVRPCAESLAGGMIAIGVGVAVAERLVDLGLDPRLKWPNDILLDGRKLGGILIRSRVDAAGIAVNVGIGLNLSRTSVAGRGERAAVADVVATVPSAVELLAGLIDRIDDVVHRRPALAVRAAWMQRAAYLGETVDIEMNGDMVSGRLRGIDEGGVLVIEEVGGGARRVVAGDLVRGPRPIPDRRPSILTR